MSTRRPALALVPQPAAKSCDQLRLPPRKRDKPKTPSPVVQLTSLSAQALELARTRGVADHDAPLARRLTRLASLATGVSMTANLCALEASALVFWSVFVLGTGIITALVCLRNYVARRVGEISARARLLPEIERLDYLASVQLARAERSRRRSRSREPRQLESVPVTARCGVCGAGDGEWCDAGLHG